MLQRLATRRIITFGAIAAKFVSLFYFQKMQKLSTTRNTHCPKDLNYFLGRIFFPWNLFYASSDPQKFLLHRYYWFCFFSTMQHLSNLVIVKLMECKRFRMIEIKSFFISTNIHWYGLRANFLLDFEFTSGILCSCKLTCECPRMTKLSGF